MMRYFLLGLSILAISQSHASAEPDTLGVISGTVVSAEDGLAIQNVHVTVLGKSLGALTTSAGQFRIDRVPLGPQTLRAMMLGQRRVDRALTVLPGENPIGTISMEFQALKLIDGDGLVRPDATLLPFTRVRVSVTTPESIRVLSGSPSPDQLRRNRFIAMLQGRRDGDVLIRIRSPEAELAIPLRSVSRLESSLGTHGRAGRGALIGFGAGVVGGVAAALIVCNGGNCENSGIEGETAIVAAVLGAGGAILGCGVGALTGALIRTERWRATPIQDLPYGDGLPVERGLRLGLAIPIPRH